MLNGYDNNFIKSLGVIFNTRSEPKNTGSKYNVWCPIASRGYIKPLFYFLKTKYMYINKCFFLMKILYLL